MNKTQLIDEIVSKTGLKKKDAEAAVAALIESVTETLAKGEKGKTSPYILWALSCSFSYFL